MATKKERIMDLLRKGVITEDEAIELLETAGESTEGVSENHSNFNKEGFDDHHVDPVDSFRQAIGSLGNKIGEMGKVIRKNVDDNVDFSKGWPKFKTTKQEIERDLGENFESIEVNFSHTNLAIFPGMHAHFKGEIRVYGSLGGLTVDEFLEAHTQLGVFDNVLKLTADSKFIGLFGTLYLPESHYEKLSVDVLSGNLSISDLSLGKAEVKLIHGNIDLEKLTAEEISTENKNGNLSVKEVTTDKVKLTGVNGNLRFEGSFKDGNFNLVNGNILLTQRDNRAQKLEANLVHGDIKLSVPEELGLVGRVRAIFGGYKTRVKLDEAFTPGKNGAVVIRQATDSLTFELETKTGTIWLKDNPSSADN